MTGGPQLLDVGDGVHRHLWVDPLEVAAVRAVGHQVVLTLRSGAEVVATQLLFADGPADGDQRRRRGPPAHGRPPVMPSRVPATPSLRNPGLGRAAAALALYEGGTQLAARANEIWRNRFAYTITVNERDPMYVDVHDLLDVLPDDRHRALQVRTGREHHDMPTPDGGTTDQKRQPLQLIFNDRRPRRVRIDGHSLTVQHDIPEGPAAAGGMGRELEPSKITFTARTHAAQQAVVTHLHRIHEQRRTDRKPLLRMVNQWGSWRARSDLPPRPIETVALPAEQRARIVDDLATFLDAEDRYNRLAIPWHRGYLLHGPPGTGKTSLVKALAGEFRLDLWYISLSDLTAEASLMGLLSEVGPRSMLLLEDIDTIQIATERDTTQGKISMSSLLNALDGVATPHGLVTVMTTNHHDRLDPALTRAGRMDVVEELGWMRKGCAEDLYRRFYGRPLAPPLTGWPDEIAPAAVAEVFKRHLDDPVAAAAALHASIASDGAETR